MKQIAATVVAAALFAASPVSAGEVMIPAGVFTDIQTQDQYLAKDNLIGAKVHDKDGKIIGDIEDLIVNDWNQVVGVVMGTGGFLGLAEKKVGVHLSALHFDDSTGKQIVSLPEASKEVLDAVSPFKRTQPAKSLLERAKEKAQELKDKTAVTTQDAVDKAKPKIEEAKEKAVEAYEKAKEAAAPAIEKAKEAAEEAKQAVEEAIDAAKEATKEMTPAPETPPAEPAPAPAAPEAAAPAEPAPAAPEAAPAEPAPQQ